LGSPVRVQRAWRTKFKSKYAPNWSAITAIMIRLFQEMLLIGSYSQMNHIFTLQRQLASRTTDYGWKLGQKV